MDRTLLAEWTLRTFSQKWANFPKKWAVSKIFLALEFKKLNEMLIFSFSCDL